MSQTVAGCQRNVISPGEGNTNPRNSQCLKDQTRVPLPHPCPVCEKRENSIRAHSRHARTYVSYRVNFFFYKFPKTRCAGSANQNWISQFALEVTRN